MRNKSSRHISLSSAFYKGEYGNKDNTLANPGLINSKSNKKLTTKRIGSDSETKLVQLKTMDNDSAETPLTKRHGVYKTDRKKFDVSIPKTRYLMLMSKMLPQNE